MLWTAEAVEDLKKLALQGKSASHISAALGVGSRNAVIGKASRIGIKLTGGGAPPCARRATRAARPQWATARYARPSAGDQGSNAALVAIPRSIDGGREAGLGLWRSPDWRNATGEVGGHSRSRLPVAARRSEERRVRLLRAHAGQRPILLRRPLPNGLSVAAAASDCTGARAPRHREFMAAVVRAAREARRRPPRKTQIRPGASAPASRRVEADWTRRGRKPASRAVAST